MADLKITLHLPIKVFYDNVSGTYLAINLVNYACTKHLEVDLHFVRKRVQWGDILLRHVVAQEQLTDIFTKILLTSYFCNLCNNLGIATHAQLEGG